METFGRNYFLNIIIFRTIHWASKIGFFSGVFRWGVGISFLQVPSNILRPTFPLKHKLFLYHFWTMNVINPASWRNSITGVAKTAFHTSHAIISWKWILLETIFFSLLYIERKNSALCRKVIWRCCPKLNSTCAEDHLGGNFLLPNNFCFFINFIHWVKNCRPSRKQFMSDLS